MENHKNIKDDEFNRKQTEFVLDYLQEHDLVLYNDNLISASKAFIINAAFRWAVDEIQKNKMSQTQWSKTKRMIKQYIAGIVDLEWRKGKLRSIEVNNDNG